MGTGQAARLLGTTVKTLQRREREGRLVPAGRTARNPHHHTESQLRTAPESDHAAGAPHQD